jgi:hypothetical protein
MLKTHLQVTINSVCDVHAGGSGIVSTVLGK